MRQSLLLLLVLVSAPALALEPAFAQEEVIAASNKTLEEKVAYLEQNLPFVKSAPQVLKVPMAYRLAPICNANTGKLIKEIKIRNDRKETIAVALTKAEQLPKAMREVEGCPQCARETQLRTFVSIEVSDWLRRQPESRREKLAEVCAEL